MIAACGGKELPQKAADSVPPPVAIDSTGPVSTSDLIHVTQPRQNAVVRSPLAVSGEARGTWYFEASFPVILVSANGDTLAVKPAQAQGEWMTENFVPFTVTLDFTAPATPEGTLILKKDNPSGLPEHDAEIRIPVRFTP
jgi:hypothetical protein